MTHHWDDSAFFSEEGEWSEGCRVTKWKNMPCEILRFKMEDEIIQGLSEMFALTASDAFSGCLYLLEKFLKIDYEDVEERTKSCGFAPWEPLYLTDPCCSAKNSQHLCCKPKSRSVTKRKVEDVDEVAVAGHCAADQSSQATFVQMGINAAQMYVDGLADLQNCLEDYEALSEQTSGIPEIFDECTKEVKGNWVVAKRRNVGRRCSSDDDCYSESCDGQNCVVPTGEGEAKAVLRCLFSRVDLPTLRGELERLLTFKSGNNATIDDIATRLLKRYSKNECRGLGEQEMLKNYGCIDDSEGCPVTKVICQKSKSCNWEPSITRQKNLCVSSEDPFFCSPTNCIGCGSITVKEGCEIDLHSFEGVDVEVQVCEEKLDNFYAQIGFDDAEADVWKDLENEKSTCLRRICSRKGGKWVREGRGSGRCYDPSATTPDECSSKKCYSQDGPQPALHISNEVNTEIEKSTLCQQYHGQCIALVPSGEDVTKAINDACVKATSNGLYSFPVCDKDATNDVSFPESRCSLMSDAQHVNCEVALLAKVKNCEKMLQNCNSECHSSCDAGDFDCLLECGCEGEASL